MQIKQREFATRGRREVDDDTRNSLALGTIVGETVAGSGDLVLKSRHGFCLLSGSYPEGSDTQDRKDNVLGIRKKRKRSLATARSRILYMFSVGSTPPSHVLSLRADRVVIVEITLSRTICIEDLAWKIGITLLLRPLRHVWDLI